MSANEARPAPAPADDSVPISTAGVEWRKVHFITPFTRSWAALVIIIAAMHDLFRQIIENAPKIAAAMRMGGMSTVSAAALVIGIVIMGLLLLIVIYSYIAWNFMGYAITEDAVLFKKGIIFRSERHLKLERIQAVDVITPLLGQVFGLSKLHVDSAGGSGSQIDIYFLKTAKCEALRAEVLARAAGLRVEKAQGEVGPDGTLPAAAAGAAGEVVAPEAPEMPLYEVSTEMVMRSVMRLLHLLINGVLALIFFLAGIIGGIHFIVVWAQATGSEPDPGDNFGTAIALFFMSATAVLTIGKLLWNELNITFNFTAALSPDGIRLRHGLTERRSQTIPPRRVHAVEFVQPVLWRKHDWWRVIITTAGYGGVQKNSSVTEVLLPVGDRLTALRALWLVQKDFGVMIDANGQPIPGITFEQFLAESLDTFDVPAGMRPVPRGARWFNWISWRRKGIALTSTMTCIRSGRITRRMSFIPHERIQSVTVSQGPFAHLAGVASINLDLVHGTVNTASTNHDPETARAYWRELLTLAKVQRQAEGPEAWMHRIQDGVTAAEGKSVLSAEATAPAAAASPQP